MRFLTGFFWATRFFAGFLGFWVCAGEIATIDDGRATSGVIIEKVSAITKRIRFTVSSCLFPGK
jgi:hypothetical protein